MKKPVFILVAILGLAVLAGLGFYSVEKPVESKQASQTLRLHNKPKSLSEVKFQDGEGQQLTLADFRGKVVLLNVWATWCAPCRHEMPTLDRLQGQLGGKEFEVLALSIDQAGSHVVRKFFNEISVRHLSLYIDPSAKAARSLKAIGLPVTLLLNREGLEIGRLVGPAEWDTPEMVSLFESVIAGRRLSSSPAGIGHARYN